MYMLKNIIISLKENIYIMGKKDFLYEFLDVWEEDGIEEALEMLGEEAKELDKIKKADPKFGAVLENFIKAFDELEEASEAVS